MQKPTDCFRSERRSFTEVESPKKSQNGWKNTGYSKTETDYHSHHFKGERTIMGYLLCSGQNGAKFDLTPLSYSKRF